MDKYFKIFLEKQLDINIKKLSMNIKISDTDICRILESERYKIQHINFQNNSVNGIIQKDSYRFFFKLLNLREFLDEITGYLKIHNILPVNKVVCVYEFINCYIIIYDYEKTIGVNCGLLNDFLVENDNRILKNSEEVVSKVIDEYKKTFKNTVYREKYPMEKFFKNRINSRLINWYNEEKLFTYSVNINNISNIKTSKIIDETIQYFSNNHSLECSLTQGDPNTLNMGIKPIFFDFSTSGYNPIIGELSVIFYSVLIADAYFCPKYHEKSYFNHNGVFDNIDKFRTNLKYEICDEEEKITIRTDIRTSKIRKYFIEKYIAMLEELNINVGREIIYFLVMRILCVFDIRTMEPHDYMYSLFILHFFYDNIDDNVYNSLRNILEKIKII